MFHTDRYEEVLLAQWIGHTPPDLVAQHLTISPALLKRFSLERQGLCSCGNYSGGLRAER